MFKKRNLKSSTAKRRSPDDDIDSASVTSIAAETCKRPKFSSKSADPGPAEPSTDEDSLKTAETSSGGRSGDPEDKEDTLSEPLKATKVVGPKGAPKNIRVTTLTDFQPDVCKDFQQTGYCGYGDTCKFLHIRGESKVTKPVEKEWETVGRKSRQPEEVPFKCVLCKAPYTSPVKTPCGHVFCRGCFMGRFRAGHSKCVICRQETGGSVQPTTVS